MQTVTFRCTSKLENISVFKDRQQKLLLWTDANPPPLPVDLGEFIKVQFEDTRSEKGFKSPTVSQVSVMNKKSRSFEAKKSWRISVLFTTDRVFTSAILIRVGSPTGCTACLSGRRLPWLIPLIVNKQKACTNESHVRHSASQAEDTVLDTLQWRHFWIHFCTPLVKLRLLKHYKITYYYIFT